MHPHTHQHAAHLRATNDNVISHLQALADQGPALSARARAVTATRSSPDDTVTVTVSPTGRLLDLLIDPSAYLHHDPAQLSRLVIQTANEAADQARSEVLDVFSEVLPRAAVALHLSADPQVAAERILHEARAYVDRHRVKEQS